MKITLNNQQIQLIESSIIGIDFEIRNSIGDKDFKASMYRKKEKLNYILKKGYIEL